MSEKTIQIAQPVVEPDEIEAAVRVLRSGKLRYGEECRRFEQAFLAAEGGRAAVAVNSGTAALHASYAALVEPGDEVLVPAFTFVATASMVLAAGAKPVFCDVDPHTFLISLEEVRAKTGPVTRAVAPVHLFGNAVPIEPMLALARELGLAVVWDAAQAQGATSAGRRLGDVADAVCYSFYPTKNLTTGEGGMIVLSDPTLEKTVRQVMDHGREAKYRHARLGYNYRMTDVAAAIGLAQLPKVEERVARRRANADFYLAAFAGVEGVVLPRPADGAAPSFNQFTILLDLARLRIDRDGFVAELVRRGVGADVHYPVPLHRQPVFAHLEPPPLPVAEDLAQRVLSLPVHPWLTPAERECVAEAVREVARDHLV
ncbi:MAG: DegT/DnrJ/EryC1/StrS family aminotransferase [Planctomycetes bacterium]|nr:DegT/DnrJ/EryC1/StrS family aminotransferase [Planctomycetota bacterium]